MSFPKVSIALCTYNGEKYLASQLDSLLNQSYKNLEIVIVDDCSDDNTYHILEKYASNYQHIRLYLNEKNLGYIKNFEKAIQLCSGDYIALSDQDDIWSLTKIEEMLQEAADYILIYHDSEFVDEINLSLNKKLSEVFNRMFNGGDPRKLILCNSISGHSMMFKKTLINEILPIQGRYHDWWIGYVAANIGVVRYLDKCLVRYRQHQKSQTDILNIHKSKKNQFNLLEWIHICSKYEGNKFPRFVKKTYKLYHEKWRFNPRLFLFILTHYNTLLGMQKQSFKMRLKYMLKQLLGR